MQIGTVDVIRCVKPSSHQTIWGENTTYTEGTVLLIFSKDEVRRAHCWRFIRIHRPNCKATNASVLSLHFQQSFYRRLLNSGDPLLRCLNKDLVVVLWSLHKNRNKLKGSEDFNWNDIGLASLWFQICVILQGTHDFGWWFLADWLSGHVSTIILMRKCDSKYKEICFNRAFIITQSRKI